MDAIAPKTRRSRFRAPEPDPTFRVVERDLDALERFNAFRYLPTRWLWKLAYPTVTYPVFAERVAKLRDLGLLDGSTITKLLHGGKNTFTQLIYQRTKKGDELLRVRGRPAFTWQSSDHNLEHRLMIDLGMASIDIGRRDTDIGYIGAYDLKLSREARERKNPFRIPAEFQHRGKMIDVGCEPDRIFGLRYGNQVRFFFLEFDRSTEQLTGVTKDYKTIERCLRQYQTIYRYDLANKNFGITSMIVLFVTRQSRGNRRQNTILDLIKEVVHEPNEQRMFAVTNMPVADVQHEPAEPGDFLWKAEWQRIGQSPLDLANPNS